MNPGRAGMEKEKRKGGDLQGSEKRRDRGGRQKKGRENRIWNYGKAGKASII